MSAARKVMPQKATQRLRSRAHDSYGDSFFTAEDAESAEKNWFNRFNRNGRQGRNGKQNNKTTYIKKTVNRKRTLLEG